MLVNEFLEQSAESTPEKEALVCRGRRLSFAEIEGGANSFANALMDQGLQRQDRVGIYLDNSVEAVVGLFGILKAGGVFVVINPQVKAARLEYIVKDCQIRVLLTDKKHLSVISGILPRCPDLGALILADGDGSDVSGHEVVGARVMTYQAILEQSPSSRPRSQCIDLDLASLIYTSGSTGNPKGVMLTHLNMVSAATSITRYLQNTSDDRVMSVLPLAFDYGLYQVLMAMKFGGTVVLEQGFVYPGQILDLVVREKITGWPIVPTIAAMLLKMKGLTAWDFSALRYITSTAQAFPPGHIARLRRCFPHVTLFSMYGLTECKRVSYLPPEELDRRPSSVGKAMPNIEVYVVNRKGREIREPRKAGELVVRGSHVMKGYWNLPRETAKVLRPGPYPGEKVLHTGDMFEKDEAGFLYFLGRRDDIIKTAGERVSPREVEEALCEREDIAQAAVVAVEDEVLGQALKAYVVLKEGSVLTEKDVIRACSEALEGFKVPRYVEFRSELPVTSTGKVLKSALRPVTPSRSK